MGRGVSPEGRVDGKSSLKKVEGQVGRTWNSRERVTLGNRRGFPILINEGKEEVGRGGGRENAKVKVP